MSRPGWYPDPNGSGGQRYFDGGQWTAHAAPPPMPAFGPAPVIVVRPEVRVNHLLHLILTLITCGLWAPIWIIMTIVDVATRK
ncbi:DUF2510 domain-containing protein [Mycobacteroides salmoniphilum]|uniref:DUF2510 domain-containing protein n=1 Tax=Mycobacteroides salmoniphilum TaxID=404941 RepID=UPI0009940DAE|nr:DUF2510 domain-containing protein [Mycobacteroides salmoniphilum]